MNITTLNAELRAIKNEGTTVIEGATPKTLVGAAAAMKAELGALKVRKSDTQSWFRKLIDGLLETVQKAICCHGYTVIDEPAERKKLAEILLKAVLGNIPTPYRLIAKLLLKGLIRRAILHVLEYLATLGDKLCEGVTCTLSPLALK